ncbi:MAG: hypothetical protein D6766_11690 [Verrucomicrobia bacterium]|nr:MAG: hypothetical protein D6766_11690 [Verrucomicrobiota bacterium]
MKPSVPSLAVTAAWLACALSFPLSAADPLATIDQDLPAAIAWDFGRDAAPLQRIEAAVVASLDEPALREAVEYRLIHGLQTARLRGARDFFCRQLRTVGTERAVPALAALLRDPDSASMARYALERIGGPRVVSALEKAAEQTSGRLRIGCIESLGRLGAFRLDGPVGEALRSADPALAAAAADALALYNKPAAAVPLLEKVRPQAPPAVRLHVDNALLSLAEKLLAQGRWQAARRIYQTFSAQDQPSHLRTAALRGLLKADPASALDRLCAAIEDPDPAVQAAAIALVREPGAPEATRRLAKLSVRLPTATRALLLEALGDRSDPLALPTLVQAARDRDEPVRLAAVRALGALGRPQAAEALVAVAAESGGATQRAARMALLRLHRQEETDRTLLRLAAEGEPARRAEAIRALADRKSANLLPRLLEWTRDPSPAVRRAALAALGRTAGPAELPRLFALLRNPVSADDTSPAAAAIEAVFRRVNQPALLARPWLEAWQDAPASLRPVLLEWAPLAATADTLRVVRQSLQAADPAEREAAVRALAEWPTPDAAPDLLALARELKAANLRALTLRACVRLAGASPRPDAMYRQALALGRSDADLKMILAGLAEATTPEALDLVEPLLAKPAVQAEAAAALVRIADHARHRDADRAKAALEAVLRVRPDSPAAREARRIINDMEKFEGYILAWQAAGPYRVKGGDTKAIFETAFPPEQEDQSAVDWTPLTKGLHDWDINLEDQFGSLDRVAAYLRTAVWAPEAMPARLELGSDDAIKAWLNGRLVHAHYVTRGLAPAQDVVEVRLEKGWNRLLLKVVDNDGGWAVACRIRRPDGRAIPGLKVRPAPAR